MITFFLDRIKGVLGLGSTTLTATTETAAAVVDRTGFNSMLVLVNSGASSGNGLTLKMYEGTVSGTVTTAVTFNATPTVIDTTSAGLTMYQIDLSGMKQYVKISLTPSTATSVTFSSSYILGDAKNNPALGVGSAVTPLRKA